MDNLINNLNNLNIKNIQIDNLIKSFNSIQLDDVYIAILPIYYNVPNFKFDKNFLYNFYIISFLIDTKNYINLQKYNNTYNFEYYFKKLYNTPLTNIKKIILRSINNILLYIVEINDINNIKYNLAQIKQYSYFNIIDKDVYNYKNVFSYMIETFDIKNRNQHINSKFKFYYNDLLYEDNIKLIDIYRCL